MKFVHCFHCMGIAQTYPCPHCGYDPATDKTSDYGLRPGAILNGKYVVGTILGQGGFGITYVGWDLALESKVAIKEYFPSGQVVRSPENSLTLQWYTTPQAEAARNAGREMFLKEARKMSRVGNIPQVVRVRDLFQENDTAYIVMDFVEGETLMARLKKTGPLSWEQAQSIFLPAIRAMEQVHQEGLIHRDLIPDNLMLLPNGDVRILDLGAAKDLTINSGASSMQVAKGDFSPLEQYTQRGGSGTWSDVYAMAATMYYSLTGVLPPNAVDRLEDDQIRWDLPQLTALPQKALAAIQQAMAVTAKARTQSMGEFLAQLEKAQTKRKEKPTPKQKAKKKKSPLPVMAAVLAAVLAVALIAGWVLWPRDVSEPQMESRPQTGTPTETETVPETETTIPTEPDGIFPLSIPKRDTTFPLTMQERTIDASDHLTVAIKQDGSVLAAGSNEVGGCNVSDWSDIVAVSSYSGRTLGLKADGTVVTAGYKKYASAYAEWTDIVAVSAGGNHVVGLRTDGTVVATGYNGDGQCDVSDWTNIVTISAGYSYTVGLKADGTVVATGYNRYGQCDVSDWTDIVAISVGNSSTVGLRADGTVVATGDNKFGRCDVSDWTDIVSVSAGLLQTVGLKADGTVVATGNNNYGQCDVSDWTDIVAISVENSSTVGLRADGTVVATGNNNYGQCDVSDWTDIVAIRVTNAGPIGLRADGTLVTAGRNAYGVFDCSNWTDIRIPSTTP